MSTLKEQDGKVEEAKEAPKVELYIPNHCPPTFDAARMIVLGESLYFDKRINLCWGASFLNTIGSGILKITVNHPESHPPLPYGFWDVINRRALFCTIDHPGLYLAFVYIHNYSDGNQIYRDVSKVDSVRYITKLCFPYHLGNPDVVRKTFGWSFEQQEKDLFDHALSNLRGEYIIKLKGQIFKDKQRIFAETGDESLFEEGIAYLKEKEIEIETRFSEGLRILK